MALTETILIPAYGHTLAGTLREINANGVASRIELKPSSPWTNGEFDSSDLSELTQSNSANADTIDANTTIKGHLYINLNANESQRPTGSPFVNKSHTGDFDVYTAPRFAGFATYHHAAISQVDGSDFVYVYLYWDGSTLVADILFAGADHTLAIAANTMLIGGPYRLRLKRVGTTFTGYYSANYGLTWIEIGSGTDASMASTAALGLSAQNFNTGNTMAAAFDYFRNWPPYDTASPVSSLVLDSGAPGTVWTPSTFVALENAPLDPHGEQATLGRGTLKYRIAAGDTNPPTLAGGTLTEAQVQALAAITGRYLKIEVTYISANGYELASFAGAKIQRAIQRPAGRALGRGLAG